MRMVCRLHGLTVSTFNDLRSFVEPRTHQYLSEGADAEVVALQLATSDSARDEVLLRQADTRLDEAARLLQQGRARDVAMTCAHYDGTLDALTATSEGVESDLQTKKDRLGELLQTAPGPAHAGLERAHTRS